MRRYSIPLVVALVILGGFLLFYGLNARNNTNQTIQSNQEEAIGGSGPTPELTRRASPSAAISPTPVGQAQFAGEVTEVIGPVSYKKSTAIEINDELRVYITSDTKIVDEHNKTVDRALLRRDATIVVQGKEVEGGLEATTITLISLASSPAVNPSQMNQTTSPTRIPTP